jgi:hypothetical protein
MEKGGSPPPKFHEDNLFTEGCSRKKAKSTYKLKGESDCWGDHQEDKGFENTVEDYTNGSLRPSKKLKEQETEEMHQQESTSKGVGWEDDFDGESDDEDSSSEDEEKGGFCTDKREDDDSYSDDDEGTIGEIFREIRNGTFDPNKRRSKFEGKSEPKDQRTVTMNSSYLEDEDSSDVATRGDCVMSTTEALHRLTRNDRDNQEEDDE